MLKKKAYKKGHTKKKHLQILKRKGYDKDRNEIQFRFIPFIITLLYNPCIHHLVAEMIVLSIYQFLLLIP